MFHTRALTLVTALYAGGRGDAGNTRFNIYYICASILLLTHIYYIAARAILGYKRVSLCVCVCKYPPPRTYIALCVSLLVTLEKFNVLVHVCCQVTVYHIYVSILLLIRQYSFTSIGKIQCPSTCVLSSHCIPYICKYPPPHHV